MDKVQPLQKPVVRSREEISSLIEQWRASGKNKTTFCRENNLVYMTFIGWTSGKKKAKPSCRTGRKKLSRFLPLKISKTQVGIFAEINLRDGSKVVLHREVSAQYLRSVLR
jgi:hypothetical protein